MNRLDEINQHVGEHLRQMALQGKGVPITGGDIDDIQWLLAEVRRLSRALDAATTHLEGIRKYAEKLPDQPNRVAQMATDALHYVDHLKNERS
jgi:hypothetical protein